MTKPTNTQVRNAFRSVFTKRMGTNSPRYSYPRDIIEAIVTPEEDTGGWGPESLTVIRMEFADLNLDPNDMSSLDRCFEISDEASAILGTPVYIEFINSAVAAVYPA